MKIAVIVENSSWYGRQIIDGVAAYAQAESDWSLVWSNPRNHSFESRLAGCHGVIARIATDEMAQIEARYLNAWRAYEGAQYRADGEREKFRAKAEKLGIEAANIWLDWE